MKAARLTYDVIVALFVTALSAPTAKAEPPVTKYNATALCPWPTDRKCPDPEVRFYLYTRSNVDEQQLIQIDDTREASNLSTSFFNPRVPSKIIIHGFRADMYLTPLFEMKTEYLQRDSYNVFFVDWFNLSSSFCYPAVVHNIKHVGECTAQLVNRIRDAGGADIHVIGFSLGAQVTNYIASSLKPDYLLPRITGLDPALPLFVTSNKDHKLDPSDAQFVDVFHCNGLMQGQIDRCGHVDFFMNGGVYQPGCGKDILSCSHHRCPHYFKESIQSPIGFYGWPCGSYFRYVVGLCPFESSQMALAGEHCLTTTRGMFLVKTHAEEPYATGRSSDNKAKASNDDLKALRNSRDENHARDLNDADNSLQFNTPENLLNHNQFTPEVILINGEKRLN